MKNMLKLKQRISVLLFLIGLLPSLVYAGDCTVITATSNQYYRVSGTLHHHTHITLPEPLVKLPYIGNKSLWTVFAEVGSNHVAFGPNSALEDGESTTLSLVTESDAYFLVLNRVPSFNEACVHIVKASNPFAPSQTRIYGKADEIPEAIDLAPAKEEFNERVATALSKYQKTIFSSYTFKGRGNPPSKLISVWDDGRFTHIRFDTDRYGVPTFTGEKNAMLRVEPDDNNNSYRISGIHKKLVASFADNSRYTITRK